MKKKFIILLSVIILIFISYQAYYRIKHSANSIIVIGNQDTEMNEEALLILNGKKINEFTLREHYSNIEKLDLSFGKNTLVIKTLNSNKNYEFEISYYGLFNWNYIDYVDGEFLHDKYYSTPALQ